MDPRRHPERLSRADIRLVRVPAEGAGAGLPHCDMPMAAGEVKLGFVRNRR